MYEIEFAPSAVEDLRSLRKFEQQQVVGVVEQQLRHQPTVETRNRKRLRPNDLADWEFARESSEYSIMSMRRSGSSASRPLVSRSGTSFLFAVKVENYEDHCCLHTHKTVNELLKKARQRNDHSGVGRRTAVRPDFDQRLGRLRGRQQPGFCRRSRAHGKEQEADEGSGEPSEESQVRRHSTCGSEKATGPWLACATPARR